VEWSGFLGEKEGVARLKLSPVERGSAKMGKLSNFPYDQE
jgi:hypothetical protein